MYFLLLFLLLAFGTLLLVRGILQRRTVKIVSGALLLLVAAGFFGLLSFWAEMLWFDAAGYGERFWTVVAAKAGFTAIGGVAAGLLTWGLTLPVPRRPPTARVWPQALAVLFGAVWGYANWDITLLWWYGVDANVADPILGRDVGFYLFSLPFYDSVYWLTLLICLLSAAAATVSFLVIRQSGYVPRRQQVFLALDDNERRRLTARAARGVYLSLGAAALVLSCGHVLNRYHLLFSQFGTVNGAGWTDVHVRLPGYEITAAVTAAVGLALIAAAASRRIRERFVEKGTAAPHPVALLRAPAAVVAGVWLLAAGAAPALTQWLWVSPNEITVERPYIQHNIDFTRAAFGLADVEEREFPVSKEFSQQTIADNRHVLSEVRLWDPRALLDTYEQFQEIRLYYEFTDVDVDRYRIDDRYRQVMVSPREMDASNLPRKSQTFVNRNFKYTHGYGLTLAPVSNFTPQGLPNLLVKDLPPKTETPSLSIDRPAIYYGEHTDNFVVANSEEAEFDYPRGAKNVYVHYKGRGGIPLETIWRKIVLGWKVGGTRFLVSNYPTADSRVMIRRSLERRLRSIAPFLKFDADPYVVLNEGRIYWIVDGYTRSDVYPYSERYSNHTPTLGLHGANYVRNAVKAVVDAYDGTVDLYVFEPDDPIIQVWQTIFPHMFKPRSDMPDALARHVRYPEGLLAAQGQVYSKYHMTDPAVFYNQEDLWVQATEKYYSKVQPVKPYYVMWKPPASDDAEFVLMQPFTPKNRQVLIGWIAGMCDGTNYGRLLAYRFPKEKRVLGTQQVETKIDQDSYLSGQLTLWDQRGSNVIRGNLLVIPLDDTLLYVEPIYLQAEAAAYPELRLVAVMHDDQLAYAESFDKALESLLEGETSPSLRPTAPTAGAVPAELAIRADRSFRRYLKSMGEEDFDAAAAELRKLQKALNELTESAGEQEGEAVGKNVPHAGGVR